MNKNNKVIFKVVSCVLLISVLLVLTIGCVPGDLNESTYMQDVLPNADETGNVGTNDLTWNNGYFKNLTVDGVPIDSSTFIPQGGTLTADLNFDTYKAVALSCDNGATLPATGTAGQWFLHTPTGRSILYMYNGVSWGAIYSIGNMTLYVDKISGTDNILYGTGSGVSAFKTITYALSILPPISIGLANIYLSNDTYTENVTIENAHNYQISFFGILVPIETDAAGGLITATGNGVKGATTAYPAFVDNLPLTNHAYNNKIINLTKIGGVASNTFRIIDHNDTTTITMAGATLSAQPIAGDTAILYDWGTVCSGTWQIGYHQKSITAQKIKFTGNLTVHWACMITYYHCFVNRVTIQDFSKLWGNDCFFYNETGAPINTGVSGIIGIIGGKCLSTTGGTAGIYAIGSSSTVGINAFIVDGWIYGIYASNNSVVSTLATDVRNTIRNCTSGIYATKQSGVINTANNIYIANGTDEVAVAASYGYID